MVDFLEDLLNKAIEKELSASKRYIWQHFTSESSDMKSVFRDYAIEKLKQAIKIGERLFNLGEIPVGAPDNVGRSLREMTEIDIKAENEIIKIYQNIIDITKKEDETTHKLVKKILTEEQERKNVLMCARGRAVTKLM